MQTDETRGTRSVRTTRVRWLSACAALWIGASLLIAAPPGPELRWAPLVWLPFVMAICLVAGGRIGRAGREVAPH